MINQILQNPENGLWLGAASVFFSAWLLATFWAFITGKEF